MKSNKLLFAGAVALLSVGLTACSNSSSSKSSDSSSSAKTTQSSKKSEKKPAKTISQNKELRTKFDKITVGDLMKKGQGGSTLADVEKLYGKPTSTASSSEQGMKVKDETWHDGNVTIVVQTIDSNVVSKAITGFKYSGRGHKLTLAAYDKLADGTSYDSIVSKYGEPDSLNESLMMGKKTVTATWLTGIKGDTGASAVLTFHDDKLTAKTQTDLK